MPRATGPFDNVRAAGKKFVGHDESAEACLRDMPDPPIHPTTLKFTGRSDPGARLLPPGQRTEPSRAGSTFGRVSSSSGETAVALMDQSLPPMAEMVVRKCEEATFLSVKRLPLGKSYVHGGEVAKPPAATLRSDFRFGLPGASTTECAKDFIQGQGAADPEAEAAAETVYQKSHRAYKPGVQRRGGVDWKIAGVDPEERVFGMPAASKERSAVEKCINPTVEGGDPAAALTAIIPKRTVRRMWRAGVANLPLAPFSHLLAHNPPPPPPFPPPPPPPPGRLPRVGVLPPRRVAGARGV